FHVTGVQTCALPIFTGVGMVATAYALTKALHRYTPSYILNLGIAGSLSDELPIGSVVEIVQDTFFELGAENEDDFIPLEQLGFGDRKSVVRERVSIA